LDVMSARQIICNISTPPASPEAIRWRSAHNRNVWNRIWSWHFFPSRPPEHCCTSCRLSMLRRIVSGQWRLRCLSVQPQSSTAVAGISTERQCTSEPDARHCIRARQLLAKHAGARGGGGGDHTAHNRKRVWCMCHIRSQLSPSVLSSHSQIIPDLGRRCRERQRRQRIALRAGARRRLAPSGRNSNIVARLIRYVAVTQQRGRTIEADGSALRDKSSTVARHGQSMSKEVVYISRAREEGKHDRLDI